MNDAVQPLKQPRVRKPKTELVSRSIRDGAIYLFRRAGYRTWFCRVKVRNGKGYVQASTKTTDEHEAFAFANDLFNKTVVRVAGGQEINAKKDQAAIYEYVTSLEPMKDEELSIAVRNVVNAAELTKRTGGSKSQKIGGGGLVDGMMGGYVEVQVQDSSGTWGTMAVTVNVSATIRTRMEEVQRQFPGSRVRAVDGEGRFIDLR